VAVAIWKVIHDEHNELWNRLARCIFEDALHAVRGSPVDLVPLVQPVGGRQVHHGLQRLFDWTLCRLDAAGQRDLVRGVHIEHLVLEGVPVRLLGS